MQKIHQSGSFDFAAQFFHQLGNVRLLHQLLSLFLFSAVWLDLEALRDRLSNRNTIVMSCPANRST